MHHSPFGPRFSLVARIRYRAAAVLGPLVTVASILQRTRVLPVTLAGLVVAALVMATPLPSLVDGSSTTALTAPSAEALAEDAPIEGTPTEDAVRVLVPATDDEKWTQDGAPAKKAEKAEKTAERESATPTPEETAQTAAQAETAAAAETSESTASESSDAEGSSDEQAAASSDDAPARKKPASGGDGGGGGLEAQVLSLVNEERAAAGCPALSADSRLAAVARGHSEDMRDRGYFDHDNPDGLSPFDRAEEAGLSHARAENIARGQQSPAAVMDSWMNSSGHRANILNCELRTLGVGVATGSGGPWWTQLFGA